MNLEFLTRHRLKKLVHLLKKEGRLPRYLNVTAVDDTFVATAHEDVSSELMPESVTTGLAKSPDLALIKALTEYVERAALIEGGENGIEACLTPRSDGIAAFPKVFTASHSAARAARANAYSEAVERFVWATWWDNPEIAFTRLSFEETAEEELSSLFSVIKKHTPIKDIYLIQPKISHTEVTVLIFFVELEGGGFISGGAAGKNISTVKFRAASELFRHSIAIDRIKNRNIVPKSFYERRLHYFGFGAGDNLVRKRLLQQGKQVIVLPKLKFDTSIPHSLQSIVAVHRCYFENQPAFIGGELERMCI